MLKQILSQIANQTYIIKDNVPQLSQLAKSGQLYKVDIIAKRVKFVTASVLWT